MTAGERCPDHPDGDHDPDEGCLEGWTETTRGCGWRPTPKAPPRPPGILDRIALAALDAGATGFSTRRPAGSHDRRWRRNR